MGLYDMFVPRPHQVEETRSALEAAQDPTKDNGPIHRVVRMLVDIGLEGRGPIRSADQIAAKALHKQGTTRRGARGRRARGDARRRRSAASSPVSVAS